MTPSSGQNSCKFIEKFVRLFVHLQLRTKILAFLEHVCVYQKLSIDKRATNEIYPLLCMQIKHARAEQCLLNLGTVQFTPENVIVI